MNHKTLVHVVQSEEQLSHYDSYLELCELLVVFHGAEQGAVLLKIEDKVDEVVVFKDFLEPQDSIAILKLPMHCYLVSDAKQVPLALQKLPKREYFDSHYFCRFISILIFLSC